MLARSAGRRHQRRTSQLLAASFAQLNLPWLAPAQLRWSASRAAAASPTQSSSTRRKDGTTTRSRTQVRSLATATDNYSIRPDNHFLPPNYGTGFRSVADKHIPFDFSNRPPTQFPPLSPSRSDLIMLNTTTITPDALIRVSHGMSGTSKELLQHLYTSLAVGRRDRAAAIAQRLTEQCGQDSPEATHAHAAYLEDLFKTLATHGRDSPLSNLALKDMQRWFEVEVRAKGVQPNEKMLIAMTRAAIRSLDGSRRDRSIRRYVDLSRELGDDAMDEVLFSEDYDDNEFAILGRATQQDEAEIESEQPATVAEPVKEEVGSRLHVRRTDLVDMDAIPEVRETAQKGVGLAGIKRAMEIFTDISPAPADASPETHRKVAYERQRRLEETSVEIAIDRWRKADEDLKKIGIHTAMQSRPVSALMWQWYQTLLPALERELAEVKKALGTPSRAENDRHIYGPYLELLPLSKVAANTILFTTSRMASGKDHATNRYDQEIKLGNLTVGLASAIESECHTEASAKQQGRTRRARGGSMSRLRKKALRALKNEQPSEQPTKKSKSKKQRNMEVLASLDWPTNTKVKLGAMLISKLIETAQLPVTREHPRTKQKVTQLQPAFLHRVKYQRGKKVGLVVPNPALMDKIQSEPVGSLLAKRMPMVVEPQPWTGWSEGGYLHYPNPVLRLPMGDKSGKDYFMAADDKKELETVYKGLTALGQVPWKVNPDVFKVQLEAWNSGEEVANFAPLHPDMPLPPEPEDPSDATARRKWLMDVREVENKKSGLHSKRCFQNFQLEIARTVVNETLYFPHNMDFRGRAYPIPPYLNHMGADNVRGLLVFADGKELGEDGLRWLKIHLATVAGHDKASMEERIEYTMSHLNDIYDSVRNPLDGRRWWLEAEDAWQTLAACYELANALDSPDPTKFVSHLPVQQDGTCNGLQHYAALGGDKVGAAQVNLEPGDRPADVYTAVAEAVKLEVEQDASEGNAIAQKLNGRLTRKCVKQPVMTNVYGVTFYGARQQVAKQLEVLFPEVNRHDAVNYGNMSHYIATKIFKSLGTMFAGAQAIQDWLGVCADRISTCLTPEQIQQLKSNPPDKMSAPKRGTKHAKKDESEVNQPAKGKIHNLEAHRMKQAKPLFKSTVVWTTPLRLPVVQPYRTVKGRTVATNMQNLTLHEPQVWDPVSKRKQLQAFPPNFIHSLDATHMLLSALKCSENGMTFASIHDSFWTHACDVNRMSEVLRDAFVAMHSEDIIGRLREEFQMRYKGCMYMASVAANSKVGKEISQLRSEMKKRRDTTSEMALEAERMRLIHSEDPTEREKGEAMVTPGSIFASEADESAFEVPTEMAGKRLGDIPSGAATDVEATNSDADESFHASVNEHDEDSMDADKDELDDAEPAEALEASDDEQDGEKITKATKVKRAPVSQRKLFVWVPLTFPEVPKKGDFDVRRLRESRYFFH
ncbi:hypothetical protein PRZ48_014098 [Zasmidium cellare]|uniref:DNA-directed RNA polymerase n=1 Tax=Zasmidium cellare TaxID=395010 RepID=A0ABR0DZZ0_ZASCE|nr:hypothetical protein PRZ48_014098 [Zasmidium cellare]